MPLRQRGGVAHCPSRSRTCSTTIPGSTQGSQRGWDQPGGEVQHGENTISHPTQWCVLGHIQVSLTVLWNLSKDTCHCPPQAPGPVVQCWGPGTQAEGGSSPQHSDFPNIHSTNHIPRICNTFSLFLCFSLFNFQLMNCSPELLYYY